jgi:hypothetical protein
LRLFLCVLCFIVLPCYCLFLFLHFTLLLSILSLTLHFVVACSIPQVLPCYYFIHPLRLCHVVAYSFLLCFTLLLFVPSLALHFVAACSFLHAWSCCYMLIPLHFTLLLFAPFMFHHTSFLHVSPYFLPSCFTLFLSYFLAPCLLFNLRTKNYYHFLPLVVLLLAPSHFILMFALCQLVFTPRFHFYKLKNLE